MLYDEWFKLSLKSKCYQLALLALDMEESVIPGPRDRFDLPVVGVLPDSVDSELPAFLSRQTWKSFSRWENEPHA
jgi:hypothetical protein